MRIPEFIAATLPHPMQWSRQTIWRPDLKCFQFSDGVSWNRLVTAPTDFSEAQLAAMRTMLTAGASLAVPLLIAKDNQVHSRNSANGAGDNVAQALTTFVIPAGSMGPNGSLVVELETSANISAASHAIQLQIAGTAISPEYSFTTPNGFDNRRLVWHNTSANVNKYRGSTVIQSSSATGFTATAIDTAVDQTVSVMCRWGGATAGETISLNCLRAFVEFGA